MERGILYKPALERFQVHPASEALFVLRCLVKCAARELGESAMVLPYS
jgi:hypothetical protein